MARKGLKQQLIRYFLICGIFATTLPLCACKKVQVFEEKKDINSIETFKQKDLEEKTYYIKDGATFKKLYAPSVRGNIYNLFCGFDSIPTLYKGERIVYWDSDDGYATDVELIRLKSIGYNFGIYNGYISKSGHFVFDLNDVEEESSARQKFNIRNGVVEIVEIDGASIDATDECEGVFGGNNKYEPATTHTVRFYKGTKEYTYELVNDTFSMIEMEEYTLYDSQLTSNGYIQFAMRDDMKSGYYYIKDCGLFRYINMPKENAVNINEIDFYEPLYDVKKPIVDVDISEDDLSSTEEETEAYQTYDIIISETKDNYKFTVYYEEPIDENPFIILKSPTENYYTFERIEGQNASCVNMAQAYIGTWQVIVPNKNLKVIDVVAKEMDKEVVTKEISKEFTFERLDVPYKVRVSLKGNLYNAYVVNKTNGDVKVLEPLDKENYEFNFSYLEGNEYEVVVICEESVKDIEISMEESSIYERETIVFE